MMVMVANQSNPWFWYLAGKHPGSIGHLYGPGAGNARGPYPFMPYALDNGAFPAWTNGEAWDEDEWMRLLRWSALSGQRPLWALVPDVVCDREATLRQWFTYVGRVEALAIRPGFAVQDGMTFADVPDDDCMLFLGGGDEWKDAAIEPWCRRFPGRVHVGRVNTWDRLVRSWRAGAVSVDGTGWWHRNLTRTGQGQLAELVKFITETEGGPPC